MIKLTAKPHWSHFNKRGPLVSATTCFEQKSPENGPKVAKIYWGFEPLRPIAQVWPKVKPQKCDQCVDDDDDDGSNGDSDDDNNDNAGDCDDDGNVDADGPIRCFDTNLIWLNKQRLMQRQDDTSVTRCFEKKSPNFTEIGH